MSTKTINLQSFLGKILLLFVGLVALIFLVFAVKIFLGNSISTRVQNKAVAEFAVGMAPNDPQSHFALAVMLGKSFLPADQPKSVSEYEISASLAPNDYRVWLALGKARERVGDIEGAETALRRVMQLAPNYSQARWAFGNLLLRQGKTEEAFKEIRRAVDSDPKFAGPAANTAWQIFDGNIEKVKQTIGDSPPVKSSLAIFLAKQKRFEEAFNIWNALPKERLHTDLKKDGESLATAFLSAKKYKKALQIQKAMAEDGQLVFDFGKLSNGGFETNVKPDKSDIFEWNIAKGLQPQISIANNEKRGGARSLVLTFNATKKTEFRQVTQTIALDGGKSYQFEGFYKANLDTGSTVKWEVVNTVDNKVLASTNDVEKNVDWTRVTVEFDLPEDSEGVIVRLVRSKCPSTVCPIKGRLWFDDIAIK